MIKNFNPFFFFFLLVPLSLFAELRLPKIVSDGMILQRNEKVAIWGWSDPGSAVKISFGKQELKAVANAAGKWSVSLPPQPAGGTHTFVIGSKKERIVIKNVLFGDVWLCTGQSNMVHAFNRYTTIYPEEIANSTNDQIRQFLVPTSTNLVGTQEDVNGGEWKVANPDNLLSFTVVGYFFAKQIHETYGIPVGIINASVGGTPIEAWMAESAFQGFDDILEEIEKNKDTAYVNSVNRKAAVIRSEQFSNSPVDPGLASEPKWFEPEYVPISWKSMTIPGYWEDQGIRELDGTVWFRRTLDLPESLSGKEAFLEMGRIIDADEFYINGQKIGNTTYQYPPRRYDVPSGVLKEGKNLLAIRVTNQYGKGGFVPDKPYYLEVGDQTFDLKGNWSYKVGAVYDRRGMNYPRSISIQNQPTALFNAMVAPYTDYSVRGVCWYQGESNAGNPEAYQKLLPAFVRDWRVQFDQPDLPVIVVQLPNFMDVNYLPEESNWAEMREAQADILQLENTGLVVAIDLGEWNDIHPMRKKPVGERAALVARKLVYEEDLTYSGPMLKSAKKVDGQVVLSFDQVGTGLVAKGANELAHFAIAGKDEVYVWANARIEGDQVIVQSEAVEAPVFVRYGWADNPDFANLYNEEGLPASPFEVKLD